MNDASWLVSRGFFSKKHTPTSIGVSPASTQHPLQANEQNRPLHGLDEWTNDMNPGLLLCLNHFLMDRPLIFSPDRSSSV